MNQKPLKKRIHAGEEINIKRALMNSSHEQIRAMLSQDSYDLLYIDAQHEAHTDHDIIRICAAAEEMEVPVQMRIEHPRNAYLIGNYLDLGLLGIKVPEIDNRKTVLEAINAFYYPPIGKRSWGGAARYGIKEHGDRLEYADWWNKNGILGIKIESVKAVLNVHELAQTGVDYLDIGPNDLLFDLETSRHPYLKSLSDCIEYIKKELVDSHIRIM